MFGPVARSVLGQSRGGARQRIRLRRSFSDLSTCSTGFDVTFNHIFEDGGARCAQRQSTPLRSGT
eukprot:4708589-Pyramimonas_sp.AAC.1